MQVQESKHLNLFVFLKVFKFNFCISNTSFHFQSHNSSGIEDTHEDSNIKNKRFRGNFFGYKVSTTCFGGKAFILGLR